MQVGCFCAVFHSPFPLASFLKKYAGHHRWGKRKELRKSKIWIDMHPHASTGLCASAACSPVSAPWYWTGDNSPGQGHSAPLFKLQSDLLKAVFPLPFIMLSVLCDTGGSEGRQRIFLASLFLPSLFHSICVRIRKAQG